MGFRNNVHSWNCQKAQVRAHFTPPSTDMDGFFVQLKVQRPLEQLINVFTQPQLIPPLPLRHPISVVKYKYNMHMTQLLFAGQGSHRRLLLIVRFSPNCYHVVSVRLNGQVLINCDRCPGQQLPRVPIITVALNCVIVLAIIYSIVTSRLNVWQ